MIKVIDNISIIGTSHVSKESKKIIEKVIKEKEPELICIELDVNRLRALLSNKKPGWKDYLNLIKKVGLFGFLFYIISFEAQQHLGKRTGLKPGTDMLTAYKIGREKKIPIALIDIPIEITMKKISRIPTLTKIKLIFKLILGSFKKENKKLINFDIKKIPSEKAIQKILKYFKKEAYIFYKILIEDRNEYMVKKIQKLRERHPGNIIVIVGAGHVEGIYQKLSQESNNTISYSIKYII